MWEFRNAYERIKYVCEGKTGDEIKKILNYLPDAKVIECAYIMEKYNMSNQEDVYVLLNASIQDLKLKDVAQADNKLDKYAELLKAKENKTDVYEMFKRKNLKKANKKYYISEMNEKLNMPRQGWVIHIAAKGYYDYRRVVLNVVPDLVKMNACFKVLTPEMCSSNTENVVTIYSTCDFNFANLTHKSQLILLEDVNVQTNKYIFGRLSAIFQNFFGTRIIDASGYITDLSDGSIPNLPKSLEPMDILNYHEVILKKYKDSDDIMQYFQEYLIGISCYKEKIFYNAYLIQDKDIEKVKNLPIVKENEDINAICKFKVEQDKTVYYVALIVHDIFDDEVARSLIREDIKYVKLKKSNRETEEEQKEREIKQEADREAAREAARKKRDERTQRDMERVEYEKYKNQKRDVSKRYNNKKNNKK